MILRDVILNEESFPGIIDILFYNLPNVKQWKFRGLILKKRYGLIKNFTNVLEALADLSNWLYHLHTLYRTISNPPITGNIHYKSAPLTLMIILCVIILINEIIIHKIMRVLIVTTLIMKMELILQKIQLWKPNE